MRITTIACDFGNVIVGFDPTEIVMKVLPDHPYPEALGKQIFFGEQWRQWDLGNVEKGQLVENILKAHDGIVREDVFRVVNEWRHHLPENQAILPVLKELKNRGYRIIACSNFGTDFYKQDSSMEALAYFDGFGVSCDYHKAKPDRAFFKTFLEDFSLHPQECLFIDDVWENIATAKNIGMSTLDTIGLKQRSYHCRLI